MLPRSDRRLSPQISVSNRVATCITDILGFLPGKPELLFIARALNWATPTRNEKRVKGQLLLTLEANAPAILPQLESPEGILELQQAYIEASRLRANRHLPQLHLTGREELEGTTLPAEATIAYFMNSH
jgi:hypothetical protein